MSKKQKLNVGEKYYFRQPGQNGYGESCIIYDDIVITDIYDSKIISFKSTHGWFEWFKQKYVCNYTQFLEGIVRRI